LLHKKSLIAALLLACTLASGCAQTVHGSDASPSNVSQPAETSGSHPVDYQNMTGEEWLGTVKAVDYGGYTFTIVTSSAGRFIDNEDSENEAQKAVAKRNQLVESRYNITIEEKVVRETGMINAVRNSIATGTQYSDLISATMPTLAKLAAAGNLTNLYSLAYYDRKAEFCSSELLNSATAGHTAYVAFDDLVMPWNSALCVYFNKSLVDGDSLYAAAKNGGWTWDKFLETAAVGGFASYLSADDTATAAFATSGVSPLLGGYGVQLSHNPDTAKLDETAVKIKELITSKSYRSGEDAVAKKTFENGSTALLIAPTQLVGEMADTSLDFGVLPLPSFDGTIRSVLAENTCGIAVPAMQKDNDRTGMLLTAFTASSYQIIAEATLQDHIYFHLRDNESALMMRKIYETLYLNAGILYSGGYSVIAASSQNAIIEAVKNGKPFADIFKREKTQLESTAAKYFR